MFGRCHDITSNEQRVLGWPDVPVEPVSRTFGLVAHRLEFAAYLPDDIGIDPLQGRTQLRLVEVAVSLEMMIPLDSLHFRQIGWK